MTSLSDKTILIVDDDPSNLAILYEILTMYDRLTASDGKLALELAENNQPDLILLDIMMPDMDGFEVAKRLKVNPKTTKIPIIFVTAKTDIKSFVEGFDVGGDDYIMKPYDAITIQLIVKEKLSLPEESADE